MKKWPRWAMVFVLSTLLGLAASGAAYSGGVMTDLGTLPGGVNSYATSINDSGQIVGYADTAHGVGLNHAFSYSGGTMTDLGTLEGIDSNFSYANGINNNGQIVGYSATASGQEHAFLYFEGVMTDLGTLPGTDWSSATSINNDGQIVGYASTESYQYHAFLYSEGTMTDLGTLGEQVPTPMASTITVRSWDGHIRLLASSMPFYTPGA